MTGDWAGNVQVVRTADVEGSEVPGVVLNDINLTVKMFDDVESLLPNTSDRNGHRRCSLRPCRLGNNFDGILFLLF